MLTDLVAPGLVPLLSIRTQSILRIGAEKLVYQILGLDRYSLVLILGRPQNPSRQYILENLFSLASVERGNAVEELKHDAPH